MKKTLVILFVLVLLFISVMPSSRVFAYASVNSKNIGYIDSVNTSNNTVGIRYDCTFWSCDYITLSVTQSTTIQVPDVAGKASIYDLVRWSGNLLRFSHDENIATAINVRYPIE